LKRCAIIEKNTEDNVTSTTNERKLFEVRRVAEIHQSDFEIELIAKGMANVEKRREKMVSMGILNEDGSLRNTMIPEDMRERSETEV
jgi:hypothetical protein